MEPEASRLRRQCAAETSTRSCLLGAAVGVFVWPPRRALMGSVAMSAGGTALRVLRSRAVGNDLLIPGRVELDLGDNRSAGFAR